MLNQKEITLNKNPQITPRMLENILKTEIGNVKKRKEDCVTFVSNLQNEIENMNTQPLIYSNKEFQKAFEEIFYRNINKNATLGQLTEREKQNLFQDLIVHQNIYECYLENCFPRIIMDIFFQLIEIILINNIQLCSNKNSLIKYLSDSILSIKTNNDYINNLIIKNSDNINEFITVSVKMLTPLTETLLKDFYKNNSKTN